MLEQKEYFCNYIFGHDTQLGIREKILEGCRAYKAGGMRRNPPKQYARSMRYSMMEKLPFMEKCKFTICAESVCYPATPPKRSATPFRRIPFPFTSEIRREQVFN